MRYRPSIVPGILALSVLSACAEAPTAPGSDDLLETLTVLGEASLGAAPGQGPSLLDALLERAIATVAKEKGEPAVTALTAELRRLALTAKQAREAGDKEAFLKSMDAVRTESARIVIAVLGESALKLAFTTAADRSAHLARAIAEAAAQGRDVTALRKRLEHAETMLKGAHEALRRGDAVTALRLAAEASDVLRHAKVPAPAASLLDQLLHRAITTVHQAGGDAAVANLTAGLRALHEKAKAAKEAGDAEAVHRLLDGARTESARIVVTVLGEAIVPQVLGDVMQRSATLRQRLADAGGHGKDVAGLVKALDHVDAALKAARAALDGGAIVQALRLTADAADLLAKIG